PQAVADAAQRVDQRRQTGPLQLAAQQVDVDVDDVGQGVVGLAPDVAAEHLAADDGVLVPGQVGQHLELAQGQGDLHPGAGGAAGGQGAPQAGGPQHRLGVGLDAAQQDAQAGQQLGEGEGLDQVVVGAGVQAGDAVLDGVASGQDENGRGPARPAQVGQDLQ